MSSVIVYNLQSCYFLYHENGNKLLIHYRLWLYDSLNTYAKLLLVVNDKCSNTFWGGLSVQQTNSTDSLAKAGMLIYTPLFVAM